jgi:EpsD family peptidyl-prolyl cis-trans isomerase
MGEGDMSRIVAYLPFFIFLSLSSLVACTNSGDSTTETEKAVKSPADKADSPVLVLVDGSPITEQQLSQAMDRFFSNQQDLDNRDHIERQVLRSLIDSRAIASLADKEIDQWDRQRLEAKVAAYREELLVKTYLQEHATPQPVTSEMVEKYYSQHPQEFGGGTTNRFEMIQTTRELKEAERRDLIELLHGLSSRQDWQSWVEKHKDLPVGWRSLTAKSELLKQPLKSLVNSTKAGATSDLHIGDQLTIVRVNAKDKLPAKPLLQVSSEIRRKLAPVKIKDAIKEIKKYAQQQVKVEIIEPAYLGIVND